MMETVLRGRVTEMVHGFRIERADMSRLQRKGGKNLML